VHTLADRVLRAADTAPGRGLGGLLTLLAISVLGVIVAPVLILLGVAAWVAASTSRVRRRT
jgi:hypothetical protein